MIEWSQSAKTELEQYLNRARKSAGEGADAGEVVEDLRCHVHEEIAAEGINIVTEEDVRRITRRLGLPGNQAGEPVRPPVSEPPPGSPANNSDKGVGMGFLFLFGVVLPLITLGVELVTAMCATTFFDPIPTLFHTLLVALVPVVNFLTWTALRSGRVEKRTALGWANGVAVGVGIFYALLFLPLFPVSAIAIIFMGMGFLSLTPLLALISTLLLRNRLRSAGNQPDAKLGGFWRGMAIGLVAIFILNAPIWITCISLKWAASEEESDQQHGIHWLRAIGHEETMLRACYGSWRREGTEFDPVQWLLGGGGRLSGEQARLIFYRVTGLAFNTMRPPKLRTGRGGFANLNEWTWDEDLGDEKVGGRIKGLSLHSSRLDAVVENEAALAYCEWILEFKNDSVTEREARGQILLPPDAVVSRLTLWVNGEEREAAFAGRSQVRKAYQAVAIQQRRDPVLVNTCGPDRILMQCFPVPRNGGVMKLRIGMTVPVMLDDAGQGLLRWPEFIERNFSVRESLRHSVWARANSGKLSCDLLSAVNGQGSLQGQLRGADFSKPGSFVRILRNENSTSAWSKDARAVQQPSFIVQTLEKQNQARPGSVILVLDRSASVANVLRDQAVALAALATNAASGIIVVDDNEPRWLLRPADNMGVQPKRIERQIRELDCKGGFDNVSALLAAWDEAVKYTNATVLWVHGPQPVELSSSEPLLQRIERTENDTEIFSFQTESGPNLVLEKLDGNVRVRGVARLGSVGEDLKRLITSWNPEGGSWVRNLEQGNAAPPSGAIEASDHLTRLWMRDQLVGMQRKRRTAEAIPLATRYQLVTPISGAVVLETDQQYRDHGLKPSDPQTVPVIPEPTPFALVLIGLVVLMLMQRRVKDETSHA